MTRRLKLLLLPLLLLKLLLLPLPPLLLKPLLLLPLTLPPLVLLLAPPLVLLLLAPLTLLLVLLRRPLALLMLLLVPLTRLLTLPRLLLTLLLAPLPSNSLHMQARGSGLLQENRTLVRFFYACLFSESGCLLLGDALRGCWHWLWSVNLFMPGMKKSHRGLRPVALC